MFVRWVRNDATSIRTESFPGGLATYMVYITPTAPDSSGKWQLTIDENNGQKQYEIPGRFNSLREAQAEAEYFCVHVLKQ